MASAPKKKSPLLAMTSGCIAGGIEATAVWPMEFIKTQLQLNAKSNLPYNGVFSGLRYTVQTTGFFSLYRGLAPTLVGSIPKAGIRFGLNAVIKENLRDKNGKLTLGKNFVAGKYIMFVCVFFDSYFEQNNLILFSKRWRFSC